MSTENETNTENEMRTENEMHTENEEETHPQDAWEMAYMQRDRNYTQWLIRELKAGRVVRGADGDFYEVLKEG